MLNIVEGSARGTKKDFASFIDRALGSNAEVRAALQVSVELGFTSTAGIEPTITKIDKLYFKLQKFKKYLRA